METFPLRLKRYLFQINEKKLLTIYLTIFLREYSLKIKGIFP